MSEKPDNFIKRGANAVAGYFGRTFKEAHQKIESAEKDVRHKFFKGPNAPKEEEGEVTERFLTSGNHAWYMGKLIELSPWEKAKKAAGFEVKRDPIYSAQFIEASLRYLFSHLKEGEVAKFIIGRELSEIFNGKENLKDAASEEELVKLIYKIAKEKFGKASKELIVTQISSGHQDLFSKLKESRNDENDSVDIEKAYGNSVGLEGPVLGTALGIASFLYEAVKKNKEIRDMFLNMIPVENGLRKKVKEEITTNPNASIFYYGLTEVAIRLADILKGRYMQGGAGRQGVYDSFISKVVRGRTGFDELKELEKLFGEKHFETLHLKTNNSSKKTVEKHRARVREAVMLAAGIAMIVTPVGKAIYEKKQAEQARRDKITLSWRAQAEEVTEDMRFCTEGKFCAEKERNPDIFLSIANNAMVQLKLRYPIPLDSEEELLNLLRAAILKTKWGMTGMNGNDVALIQFVDEFIQDDLIKTWFMERGIVPAEPYANLRPYRNLLGKTAGLKVEEDDIIIDLENGSYEGELKKIGGFTPTETSAYERPKYELYLYTSPDGTERIMAKGPDRNRLAEYIKYKKSEKEINGMSNTEIAEEVIEDIKKELMDRWDRLINGDHRDEHATYMPYREDKKVSANMGKKAAKEYVDSMRKYSILDFIKYSSEFTNFCQASINNVGVLRIEESEVLKSDKIGRMEDPFGEFAYDLITHTYYDDERKESLETFLAKRPEENVYTTERAQEAAERFLRIYESHWYNAPKPEDRICTPPEGTPVFDMKKKTSIKDTETPKQVSTNTFSNSSRRFPVASRKNPYDESVFQAARLQTKTSQHVRHRLDKLYRT